MERKQCNENDKLKNIFNDLKQRIKNVDTKNGLLIPSCALIMTIISIFNDNFQKWSSISMIVLLSFSIVSFVISIAPIFWNKNEKSRNSSIHIPNIWKSNDLSFLLNDVSYDDYAIQIKRVANILKFKYIMQWAGIIFLFLSIILLIISIPFSK